MRRWRRNLRVDANVSVRPEGSGELRTRTELKNMNSFTFVARGIDAEVERQIGVWESGGEVKQETYDFDAGTGTLTPRRAKEEADDYRYFPSPTSCRSSRRPSSSSGSARVSPELPAARIRRIEADLDLERATVLVTGGLDALWEQVVRGGGDRVAAANVIANNLVGAGVDPARVPAAELARLVDARDRLPRAAFDEAISSLGEEGFSADPYLGQEAVSDTAELEPIVARILEANPSQVEAYRNGKEGLRVLRRPGDEGDRRAGEPPRRLGAGPREARRSAVGTRRVSRSGNPRASERRRCSGRAVAT